jgi:SPP1 gp7 family putative phage head morphogenesis protein
LTPREITRLKNDYKNAIDDAYAKFNRVLQTNLVKDAHSNYKSMLRALEVDLKHNITKDSLTKLTPAKISRELNKSIGGRTIEQRLKLNARNLYKDATKALQEDILKAIKEHQAQGHSIDKMARTIKSKLNTDTYRARRIARTESHRMREFSTYESQIEAQKYEMFKRQWLATGDNRTRHEHLVLDSKFEGEDGRFHYGEWATFYPGGFGVAKMDIHCRCTVIANFDDVIADPNFIEHGDNQEEWEDDIMDKDSRYNKDKLIMDTLDPNLYPFDVAMEVSEEMEAYMAASIEQFEAQLKTVIDKVYYNYIKAEYTAMNIELQVSKELDVLYLARQQKIFKKLAEAYPEGAKRIKILSYDYEPRANYNGYMMPFKGKLNINSASINNDIEESIRTRWCTQGSLEFGATDRTLVHEYGHWVDLTDDGWASAGRRKPNTIAGYGRTNNQEAFAESFVNAVTAPKELKDPEMVKFVERVTNKKVAEIENFNLEVLTE